MKRLADVLSRVGVPVDLPTVTCKTVRGLKDEVARVSLFPRNVFFSDGQFIGKLS